MADSNDFGIGYALGSSEGGNNNGGGGFGWGSDAWVLIILFALIFGWGNGGWGGGMGGGSGVQGALTRTDLAEQFAINDLQSGVRNVNDAVNAGFQTLDTRVCQQSYETAQMLNGVTAAVNGGFSALNTAICQNAYENAGLINGLSNTIQGGFNAANIVALQNANAANIVALQNQNALQSQLADCCCQMKCGMERGFADTNYNMATNTAALQTTIATSTRDIIDSQNAGTRAILDYLCQEKIADLQSENQGLKLAASQAQQNNYLISQLRPTAQPAYLTCNPFTGTYGFPGYGNAYNNGCSGCGC